MWGHSSRFSEGNATQRRDRVACIPEVSASCGGRIVVSRIFCILWVHHTWNGRKLAGLKPRALVFREGASLTRGGAAAAVFV